MSKFSPAIARALVLAALSALVAVPKLAVADGNCSIAATAFDVAHEIRGLAVRREVPCHLKDRNEVEKYLRDAIGKKIPAKRLQGEERTYKLIGLIDKNYDYVNGLIALYTDQIGGFYDPEKKYYAMAAWMPEIVQMPIAVHELTHALQDQHFNLQEFVDDKRMFGDPLLARTALVEGDATAVMLDYTRKLQGQQPIAKDENVSSFIVQNLAGSMLSPGLSAAPPALQALLIFPYISGLNFTHHLLRKGGYREIDRVFRSPPRSSEEILHPEKFGSGKTEFVEIEIPKPPETVQVASLEPEFTETEGEFIISTLLRTYLPVQESGVGSQGWGGDRIVLYSRAEKRSNDLGIVVWETAWDSEKDSREFFDAVVKAYGKRFGIGGSVTDNSVSYNTEDFGGVVIERTGERVKITAGV